MSSQPRRLTGSLASIARGVKVIMRIKGERRWSLDSRLVTLTVLNALLYWPWHLLRIAFDAGDHHPTIVLGMIILTLWMWLELAKALIVRAKIMSQHARRDVPRQD